jgi:hypothetical protein
MEYSIEDTMVLVIEYPVHFDERSSRMGSPRKQPSNFLFNVKCQAEKHNHVTGILYGYEPKVLYENLLWNTLRQAETKSKILRHRIPRLTECEISIITPVKLSARSILNQILLSLVKCKLAYMDRKRDMAEMYLVRSWYNKYCIKLC